MECFLATNDPLCGAHKLVSILTTRDPSPLQRFWPRVLRGLLNFLSIARQEGNPSALTPQESLMALQCLETLETSHRREEYLGGVLEGKDLRELRYELAQMVAKSFRLSSKKKKQEEKHKAGQGGSCSGSTTTTTTSSFWCPVEDLLAPKMY